LVGIIQKHILLELDTDLDTTVNGLKSDTM
jgi:hypothetical protein